jgi:tetratricopeptide (TPR) repeat protein
LAGPQVARAWKLNRTYVEVTRVVYKGDPDPLTITDGLEAQVAAHLLISAAFRTPEQAGAFIRTIERRELISVLSPYQRKWLAMIYGNLADQTRRSSGSTEEVMTLAEKSLALDPQSETGMIVKALMLNRSGQLQAGLVLLEEVTTLHPDSSFGWACLASLRLANSDFGGAENAARRAVCCQGGWGQSLLATALFKQGRCHEALPYAQSSVRDRPDAPDYLLVLGDVYWCLGDEELASQVYRRLETVAPAWVRDRAPYVRERMDSTR